MATAASTNPYKTLTKAVAVLIAAKSVSPNGVTINLASGDYDAANGEKFPIVVPRSVSIIGTNYGTGASGGSFIDGVGEDTIFERIVHAAPHSVYTTLEVVPPASVNLGDVYVGASKIKLPNSRALYASVDVIGTLSGLRIELRLLGSCRELRQRQRRARRERNALLRLLSDPRQRISGSVR